MLRICVSIFTLFCLISCSSAKKVLVEEPEVITEYHTFDTLTVSAQRIDSLPNYVLSTYHPSFTRHFDLIHTKLNLKFDWSNKYVLGQAYLTLSPLMYAQSTLALDAKSFDIHSIQVLGEPRELAYQYDGYLLIIDLEKSYSAGEKFELFIDYTAKPDEVPAGGSDAITSDKGCYFINADGSDPNKPQQIWTQGETEANSHWFPTIDKPNERCTQEIYLTVEDRFTTLSNGLLEKSVKNEDGTRTDYWKMDISNPPYLFMMAIGEYAVVREDWNGIPVEYYVESAYEEFAAEIFNHTPEMMTFFSEYTGVPYPWPKMAHVIVRDYVSGAMENTTGIVYGEFVQKNGRELIDNDNDDIVAHEIIHHWFGDMVTTESWSNVVLNEGFANYGEFLWRENKNGLDAAEHHRLNEMNGYFNSARNRGMHALVDFAYNDKEDMFDAHSYNKGGLVLHMLRRYVGDDAFRAGLKKYLLDNAFSDVEAHELRLAFEDVTGEDLNWFFDQWFYNSGHPVLEINYSFNPAHSIVSIEVNQRQDPETNLPIYKMPVQIYFYDAVGNIEIQEVWLDSRSQEFFFQFDQMPVTANFDGRHDLLFEKIENKDPEQYAFQYQFGKSVLDRFEALIELTGNEDYQYIFKEALSDTYYAVRRYAVNNLTDLADMNVIKKIESLSINDPHSAVRRAAVRSMSFLEKSEHEAIAKTILKKELVYSVVGEALGLLNNLNPAAALEYAENNMNESAGSLESAFAEIFANSGDQKYLGFFVDRLESISIYRVFDFYDQYLSLLKEANPVVLIENMGVLKQIGLNQRASMYRRFAATTTLNKLKTHLLDNNQAGSFTKEIQSLDIILNEIIDHETNEMLKSRYNSF